MKLHLLFLHFLMWSMLFFMHFGCQIDTARPSQEKQLVIASDYLEESDTLLFHNFMDSTGIRVIIRPWNKSKIVGEFKINKYATGIDVFMLKSLFEVHDLQKKRLFQPLKTAVNLNEAYVDFSSEKYDYFGFGYDPFIVAYPKGERTSIKMYNDLTRHWFVNELDKSDLIVLIAPIFEKLKKTEAHKWMNQMHNHVVADTLLSDSLLLKTPILTTYSNYQKQIDSLGYKNKKIIFPNNKSTGTFYNLRTIAIASQAENYDASLQFIDFYLVEENNVTLNKALGTIAINSSESGFRKYCVHSEKMLQYYVLIERSVNRFRKK